MSIYRSTRNETFGVRKYHLFPWFYQRKAWLIRPWQKRVYISEFQMEPWVIGSIKNASLEHQFETFDLHQMQENFLFARRSGFRQIDLWGAEWWYWMKTQKGHPEFWDIVRSHSYPQFIISVP